MILTLSLVFTCEISYCIIFYTLIQHNRTAFTWIDHSFFQIPNDIYNFSIMDIQLKVVVTEIVYNA